MTERDQHDPTVVPGIEDEPAVRRPPGARRRKRRGSGCLPILVVLAIIGTLGWFGVTRGIDFVQDRLGGEAEDYPGPGTGRVVFEVQEGDSAERGRSQPRERRRGGERGGVHRRRHRQRGEPAGRRLRAEGGDEGHRGARGARRTARTTAASGSRCCPARPSTRSRRCWARTPSSASRSTCASSTTPEPSGSPAYAEDAVEGFLAPGAYVFGPDDTPRTILAAMAARFVAEAGRRRPRGGGRGARLHAAAGPHRGQPGAGRGSRGRPAPRSRGSSTTGSRSTATRAVASSRSTPPSTTPSAARWPG